MTSDSRTTNGREKCSVRMQGLRKMRNHLKWKKGKEVKDFFWAVICCIIVWILYLRDVCLIISAEPRLNLHQSTILTFLNLISMTQRFQSLNLAFMKAIPCGVSSAVKPIGQQSLDETLLPTHWTFKLLPTFHSGRFAVFNDTVQLPVKSPMTLRRKALVTLVLSSKLPGL